LDVDGKSNEIAAFTALLDQVPDLTNVVVLADRMHTQRDHARYSASRGAFYVLPASGKRLTLFAKLDALNWASVPVPGSSGWMTFDHGHSRQEPRTIQVLPAPDRLNFPDTRQVLLLERHTYALDSTMIRTEAILGITSLTARQPPQNGSPSWSEPNGRSKTVITPTRANRGSSRILNSRPSFSLAASNSSLWASASETMGRNFSAVNSRPPRPTRTCRNITGPSS
jgi:hypothetical protein